MSKIHSISPETQAVQGMALSVADPELYGMIQAEAHRQKLHLELIASENFVSQAVLEAVGSVLTNKYAEGYAGRRYYGGCEAVDDVERLAIARAKALFGAEHVNVQPHSGSQANAAVYFGCLKPGDKVLAMGLDHGGHLTHGHPKNISGAYFEIISYGVDPQSGRIDYDQVEQLALKHRPNCLIAGASAYARTIDFERMAAIARQVGALFWVDMAHISGLVATGHHPSPIPHADIVTTTTHKTLRGPRGGMILCKETYAKAIDAAIFPGTQGGPLMHVIAGKAACFGEALKEDFKAYQEQILLNAKALAQAMESLGFKVVSGGTDNHLFLIDLRDSHPDLTGKAAQVALEKAHITLNRNTVPGETRSPFEASGLRIGTPAITTLGFKEAHMPQVAQWIAKVLNAPENEAVAQQVAHEVHVLLEDIKG